MSKVFPLLKFPLKSWNAIHFWVFFISDETPPCYNRAKYTPDQLFITHTQILKDIQSERLTSTEHKPFSTWTLESRTSFTLNGKCTLPSCGQNINNTEICWRLRNCSAYYSEQLSCPGFPNALMMTSPCSVELWSWVISVNKIRCNATWRNGSLLRKLWNANARDLGSWLWLLLVSIFPTVKWLFVTSHRTPRFLGEVDRVRFAQCPMELNVLNQDKLVY